MIIQDCPLFESVASETTADPISAGVTPLPYTIWFWEGEPIHFPKVLPEKALLKYVGRSAP